MSNHNINAGSCCDDEHVAEEPENVKEYLPFVRPVRRILTQADMDIFSTSPTRDAILDFIISLNDSVEGKTNDEDVYESEVCAC